MLQLQVIVYNFIVWVVQLHCVFEYELSKKNVNDLKNKVMFKATQNYGRNPVQYHILKKKRKERRIIHISNMRQFHVLRDGC